MSSDFPLLIKSLLPTALANNPDQSIISDGLARYSYAGFYQRLMRLSGALQAVGMGQGGTLAVMDWDTHRYLECFFAVPMFGAVLHTINVRLAPAQIAYTIDHAEDDIILVHVDFLPLLETVMPLVTRTVKLVVLQDNFGATSSTLPDTPLDLFGDYENMLAAAPVDFGFPDFGENSRATTFYTTGTTGDPKGVAYTHRQLVLHSMAVLGGFGPMAASNRFHNHDVYMPMTPMFHVHGWGFPYAATLLGVKQIYPGYYEPANLLRLIVDEGVTFSHCVPTILNMLLTDPVATHSDLSHWKVVIGGSALPAGLAQMALDQGINVFAAYGLSETCPLLTFAHLDPADEGDVMARCRTGKPAPMVDLRVVDAEMQDVPRDGVSTGEVVARAPWLTETYVKDAATTATLWRGGYLHTGDVGRLDKAGNLLITDRIKDVIKSGGEWISSLALESIASACTGVAEVAAIGIPDAKWGERPLLLIVPNASQPCDKDLIMMAIQAEITAGHMSKWALPDRVELVEVIDKTSVGKIDKKALRTRFACEG